MSFISATESRKTNTRIIAVGMAIIVLILAFAAVFLLLNLPDANAFDARVVEIFAENDDLTSQSEVKLLEILAQSGGAFAQVLASYRMVIFVLLLFATALLVTCFGFLLALLATNRRMGEIQRRGIDVTQLQISRSDQSVTLNDMEFKLTPAALETLSVLAEARLDDEVLSGVEIESIISGKPANECDEAAGATRIKRLRDALGNQIVAELLVKNIARQGYVLSIDRRVIEMR